MAYATIPRAGLVETVNAKHLARFGKITESYRKMLFGEKPPRHVLLMAEKFKRERDWEKNVMSEVTDTSNPQSPTCEETSAALDNLRAVVVHATTSYGPAVTPELIKLAKWLVWLNREHESKKAAAAAVKDT